MQTNHTIPASLRAAFVTWLVAIAAGVFETIVIVASGQAGNGAAVGVTVRTVVFLAAAWVNLQMLSGRRWARLTLAVGLGFLGTLSLVVDPVIWLVRGNSLTRLLAHAGATDVMFGSSRVVHVAAVLAACALMSAPSANGYFRMSAENRAGASPDPEH
jgi:hypothetical protein